MSASSLTYYGGDIADPSSATPGLFNRRFSTISQNVDQLNTAFLSLSSLAGVAPRTVVQTSGLTTTVDLASGFTGLSSLSVVGTITQGTWQGAGLAQPYGGTGLASTTTGDLLVGASGASLALVSDVTAGQVLKSGGAAAAPAYSPQYVQTLAGTVHQVSVSSATGDVTVSLPSALTVPGTLQIATALYVPDGSASAPGLSFASETSLGFYRSANSTLAQSYGTFQASQISSFATSYTSSLVLSAPLNPAGVAPVILFSDSAASGMGLFRDTVSNVLRVRKGVFYGMNGMEASALTVDNILSVGSYADFGGNFQGVRWFVQSGIPYGNTRSYNNPNVYADATTNALILLGSVPPNGTGELRLLPSGGAAGLVMSSTTLAWGYTTTPASEGFAVKANSSISGYLWVQGLLSGSGGAGLFVNLGTALRPVVAFASEQSLGWYCSSASRMALSYGYLNLPSTPPSNGTASGATGDLTWDASYAYVCVSANSWRRAALSAF